MTKVPIQIYLEKDKKTEWEKYADDHGMSITALIKNAVDYFISNTDKVHESTAVISNSDIQETKELIKQLSDKVNEWPSMMQQALTEAMTSNRGLTFQALTQQPPTKDRLERILDASKQRVMLPGTLKAALPDIEDNEIYDTLNILVKEGKAERTNLGWRRKS